MKHIHRIAVGLGRNRERTALQQAGVQLRADEYVFLIGESDERWPTVRSLVERFDLIDTVSTTFTSSELSGSDWLSMHPAWHHGYPQPDDDFGYLQRTFDLSEYCEHCGIGARQNAPFRIKGEPKWGSKSVLQLNWVFDEYFCTPETWEGVFQPAGIASQAVIQHRSGRQLETVVQLVIPAGPSVQVDALPYENCTRCGRKKYLPVTRGFAPGPLVDAGGAFKSREFFGSGASAFNLILIPSELYEAIKGAGVKGVTFQPCSTSAP